MNAFIPPPQRTELIWAAVDFDGTLVESTWPEFKLGEPIVFSILKLASLRNSGYKIAIHTARGWEHYELIEAWLNHYQIPYDRIVCGKLLAAVYVDDRAVNANEDSWLPV